MRGYVGGKGIVSRDYGVSRPKRKRPKGEMSGRKGIDVDVSVERVIDTSIDASKTVIEGRCASLEKKTSSLEEVYSKGLTSR